MYTPLTDEQLDTLANDVIDKKVEFLNDNNSMYFIALGLMTGEQLQELEKDDIINIYEYISNAMSRGFYGSFRTLNRSDTEKLQGLINTKKQLGIMVA